MIPLDDNGYFVTGSDTDVGKTYIACEIVRQLRRRGVDVETRKPVESGCALVGFVDVTSPESGGRVTSPRDP